MAFPQSMVFRCWIGLLFLFGGRGLAAAETGSSLTGEQIYFRLCIDCHGDQGQGVPEKYDEPLNGDWSVEKLSKVIHKTMPGEKPEQCEGADADRVARYIHDTFYSREARLKIKPPRMELARLTNRQYLNSVADLLQWFTGTSDVSDRRGVDASYYSTRNYKRDSKVLGRVDDRIDFDFGEGVPEEGKFDKPEEFSIQWTGSILAEDTGFYEFILKTENGARLWVNDQDTALIDAWVATGTRTEHRARLRLLGGRAYPLKLDFFKFKGKTASVSLQWVPPHGVQEPIPKRNLSPDRSRDTLVVSAAFPPDDSSQGYERGTSVSKAWDTAATHAALEVAVWVADRMEELARKSGSKSKEREGQVRDFCERFVEGAFRRPLSAEEKTRYVDEMLKDADPLENGVKRVVLLALKSPRFLFPGLEPEVPDDYAVAARLALALWDSVPDRDLWRAAADGALHRPEQIRAQAERMLRDLRTRSKMRHFFEHWLQMDHATDIAKDPKAFPGFDQALVADMRTSLMLFLDDVAWNGEGDYRQLLLADTLYLNPRLAAFYGVDLEGGDGFQKVALKQEPRSGVMTHPYLLTAFSYPSTSSPIHRGVFLTRNIVGRSLKPPPMAIEFKDNEFAPELTMRQKVEELTRADACQGCHSIINPLGFSLENFDAVGRFRTKDNEKPIDAAGDYTTLAGRKVRFQGARDVAKFAAGSAQAQHGFILQLFQHVTKQSILAYGPGVQPGLQKAFSESKFNLRRLLVEMAVVAAGRDLPGPAPSTD